MAQKNKKIVTITAAMRDGVGLNQFSKKYPNRFFDVGIAEEHALTFAAGLAKDGMIPFVSIYSSFYQRAYDQIIHDICLQNLPVVMCIDRAGIVGNDGETHQGLFDLAFMKIIPNITIMAPKNFEELTMMMEFAVSLKSPVVIRYPRGGESSIAMKSSPIKIGKGEILRKGSDITIIAIGNGVPKGLGVAEILEKENISAEVINVRFLKPFPELFVLKSIIKTNRVAVIEDGTIVGGLSSSISELLVKNNLSGIDSYFFAYPDEFVKHGSVKEIESKYHLDDISIAEKIINNIKK